ncbi:sialate O-acetylesterase [Mucilaginibacter sp. cycad4]|uniref:sialate O-acetylesterase n=1 Tax=Mucilaginibacter sp. cycad4 TaxID=3342096 RepID=UPI002AAAE259|nr:sialate O-acetylesterase [Mucilaginibacter gossypii]WPU99637.1 sialate O-acetylesterase [Mucilaginibacter gossypii]
MRSVKLLLVALFACLILPCYGIVRLPQLVADGMVLQRDAKVKIWGWADAGEKVAVNFQHKTYRTVTDQSGSWKIALQPMKAGGPYTMEITGSNHVTIRDILIGDVWFCSGQSNMVLPMERVKEKYPDEIAKANYPQIRNFFVKTEADVTKQHQDLLPGKWAKADSVTVLGFGAASWFFAKQLYQKYHVPIGIINSSVGGTPIEAWIGSEGLKNIQSYHNRVAQFSSTAFMDSVLKKHPQPVEQPDTDKGLNEPQPWYDTTYRPHNWHHFWLPGYWADQGIKGLNGVVWFRKEINLPASVQGKAAKLFLGRIVDADQTYVNGSKVGNITYQYPPRRYAVPAGLLRPGKNIIVVRVINTAGKGGFVPDKPYYLAIAGDTTDLRGDWQYKVGQVFEPVWIKPEFSAQNEPTGLYNTMVAPVINYTIKGMVWYQGESNSSRASEYGKLLKALIADWRSRWQEGNIPFIYAQLPNFNEAQYLPTESSWAQLRDGQLNALEVPNTGMAVTIDAGEWNDIHPLNKKTVGERLARAAENVAYGDVDVVPSGPIYQSAKIEGNKVEITFKNTGAGLIAGDSEELSQFAIAGADKKFVWAKAIIKGNKVVVWSDKIPAPLHVRYAWADNPDGANLYNKEGLPASPFQTDKLQ